MQTVQLSPRKVIERALDNAPDQVLRAMADVFAASEQPHGDRTVIVRLRPGGEASSETLTSAPESIAPSRPISLLEAFQAMGQPYYEALERGREARKELLAAEGGVMSAADVAKHLGITRQAVDKRRRANRLLGVTTGKRGYAYPTWQFTDAGMLPGLEEILAELWDHDPMSQVIFFLSENAYVGDEIPLHVLRRGEFERVMRAAENYLEHGSA